MGDDHQKHIIAHSQMINSIYWTKSYIPEPLIEKYIRFNIPVLYEDIFSGMNQTLTFKGNIFIAGYDEAFESPLETNLGLALYAKTSK